MGFFKNIIKTILKVSRPIFTFEDNELRFKISSDFFYTYTLENFDIKTRHDPYVFEAYTLKTSDIFLEYVQVDDDTFWQGDSLGLYEDFLKEQCRFQSLKTLEKRSIKNYEFRIYEVEENHIIHLVYIWEANKDIFILDNKVELYKILLSNLDKSYIYKFEDKLKINFDFNSSIVKQNAFSSYFSTDNNSN